VGQADNSCDGVVIKTPNIDETSNYDPEKFGLKKGPENQNLFLVDKENFGPPIVVEHLENLKFSEGSEITFKCKIIGNPLPKVSWFKDSISIQAKSRFTPLYDFKTNIATLKIANLRPEDVGNFRCYGVNPYGDCETEATAFVLNTPNIDETNIDPKDYKKIPYATRAKNKNDPQPPVVIIPLVDINFSEPNSVVLRCKIFGHPVPKVFYSILMA
jgi:hypothetical protein